MNKRSMAAWFVLVVLQLVASSGVLATPAQVDVTAAYWGGIEFSDQDTAINRFSLRPNLKKRWGRKLQLDLSAEFDWANDEVGLGTLDTYAPLSKPLIRTDHLRLSLSRATLRYRADDMSVTLGKQTLAWGVLDGLRVADRADPVRRRDFVLTEQRPERLSRWGIRSRKTLGGTDLDVAVLFDNTVDQLASADGAFFPRASRSTGGYDATSIAALGAPPVDDRGHGLKQATYAVKLGRRVGAYDLQLIGLHGPDTEALIDVSPPTGQIPGLADVRLRYATRSLLAVTLQRALGSTVLRFEGAVIPNQSINLATAGSTDKVVRVLAGVGVDVKVGSDWFVNAQLGIDQLERHSIGYARPRSDVVTTLRAQRNYVQDRLSVKAELIGLPGDGDGYLGGAVSWQFDDRLKAAVGVDWLFGNRSDLFGQFGSRSRAWLRLSFTP